MPFGQEFPFGVNNLQTALSVHNHCKPLFTFQHEVWPLDGPVE